MRKQHIIVDTMPVEVWRKRVKNLNLTVYGPDGRVRVSVPLAIPEQRVRQMVKARMGWIRKQQARFRGQPIQEELLVVSGECHFLWGRPYLLEVIEGGGRHSVSLVSDNRIRVNVRPGTSSERRIQLLNEWYRGQLKAKMPALLEYWQAKVGEQVNEWNIKRMKTRWGTCNILKRRLWLNLELAKKPAECLEYILVHEMVHLLERNHNERFYANMDIFLPQWRDIDNLLKQQQAKSK